MTLSCVEPTATGHFAPFATLQRVAPEILGLFALFLAEKRHVWSCASFFIIVSSYSTLDGSDVSPPKLSHLSKTDGVQYTLALTHISYLHSPLYSTLLLFSYCTLLLVYIGAAACRCRGGSDVCILQAFSRIFRGQRGGSLSCAGPPTLGKELTPTLGLSFMVDLSRALVSVEGSIHV